MSMANAFDSLLFLVSRPAIIYRPHTDPAKAILDTPIKISSSNYYRHLAGPEETHVAGREFVISKKTLDASGYPRPKKGDHIKDPDLGHMTISEVREMFVMGGSIVGYRIKTS